MRRTYFTILFAALVLLAPVLALGQAAELPAAHETLWVTYPTTTTAASIATTAGATGTITVTVQPDTARNVIIATVDDFCPTTATTHKYTMTVTGYNQFGYQVHETISKTSNTVTHVSSSCTSYIHGKLPFSRITGVTWADASGTSTTDMYWLYLGDKFGFTPKIIASGDVWKRTIQTAALTPASATAAVTLTYTTEATTNTAGTTVTLVESPVTASTVTFPNTTSTWTTTDYTSLGTVNVTYNTLDLVDTDDDANTRIDLWVMPRRSPPRSALRPRSVVTDLD